MACAVSDSRARRVHRWRDSRASGKGVRQRCSMHKNAFLFRCSESDRAEFGMNDGGMRSPMQGTLAEVILLFSQGVSRSTA